MVELCLAVLVFLAHALEVVKEPPPPAHPQPHGSPTCGTATIPLNAIASSTAFATDTNHREPLLQPPPDHLPAPNTLIRRSGSRGCDITGIEYYP